MAKRVRASLLRLRNILGVSDVEIAPGQVTIIEGKNAAGKSSILDGVKSVLQGGKDATLKRVDAKDGEAVIEFDNDLIAQRIVNDSQKGGERKLIHREFGALNGAGGRIDKMFDAISLDPARFLSGTDEDRLAIITETARIDLPNEKIAEETGLPLDLVKGLTSTVAGMHPLDLVQHLRKSIAAIRLEHNKQVKQKTGAIDQLKPSLSGVDTSVDWVAQERSLRDTASSLRNELELSIRAADGNCKRIVELAGNDYLEARTQKRAECDRKIDEFRRTVEAEFTTFCANEQAERDRKAGEARERAEALKLRDREHYQPQIEAALGKAEQAQAKAETISREVHTKATIEQLQVELNEATQSAESLTRAIGKLDELKGKLLSEIPIDGIDLRDGVLIDRTTGVAFSRMNLQKRMGICIEVAKLRAKDVDGGLVIIDNLECLDSEHFEAFVEMAVQTDLQWLVGRVSDKPGINIRIVDADGRERRAAA